MDWSARVELAIDPGYAGAYAVLALQWEPGLVRVVDELYVTQQVAATVIRECRSRKWWDRVTGGVIDIAGRQHHAMPSQVEIWQAEAGIHLKFNRGGCWTALHGCELTWRIRRPESPGLFSTRNA